MACTLGHGKKSPWLGLPRVKRGSKPTTSGPDLDPVLLQSEEGVFLGNGQAKEVQNSHHVPQCSVKTIVTHFGLGEASDTFHQRLLKSHFAGQLLTHNSPVPHTRHPADGLPHVSSW